MAMVTAELEEDSTEGGKQGGGTKEGMAKEKEQTEVKKEGAVKEETEEEEIQEETRAVERVQVVVSEEEADDKMQDAEDKLTRLGC